MPGVEEGGGRSNSVPRPLGYEGQKHDERASLSGRWAMGMSTSEGGTYMIQLHALFIFMGTRAALKV